MKEEQSDDIERRLNAAVEAIIADPASLSLDIDQFVELIDYAIDTSSLSKAWMLYGVAQSLYPGHELLRPRLSFLVYQEGDTSLSREMVGSLSDDSLWASIIRTLLDPDTDNAVIAPQLRRVVDGVDRIGTDLALNIIMLARIGQCAATIKELQNEIYAKADYPDEFLLDLLDLAKELKDDEWVDDILARLEQSSPFSPDFWEEKALRMLENGDDLDEALSTVEYSLAIEPDSEQGLTVKARIMSGRIRDILIRDDAETSGKPVADDEELPFGNLPGGSASGFGNPFPAAGQKLTLSEATDEYVELVRRAAKLYPDNFDLLADMVSLYIENSQESFARKLPVDMMVDYSEAHPDHRASIDLTLHICELGRNFSDMRRHLERYYRASSPVNELDWTEWSQWCTAQGMRNASLMVLNVYYAMSGRKSDTCESPESYFEMLYLSREYRRMLAEVGALDVVKACTGKSAGHADSDIMAQEEEITGVAIERFRNAVDHLSPVALYILMLAAARMRHPFLVKLLSTAFAVRLAGRRESYSVADALAERAMLAFADNLCMVFEKRRIREKDIDNCDIYADRGESEELPF